MAPVLAFGVPGGPELIIGLIIVLVLFGNRLPGVMRSLGQSVGELKKGLHESESEPMPELDHDPRTPDSRTKV